MTARSSQGKRDRPASPTLSIVIVSHNTRELLRACLCSVQASGVDFSYEVFVVDTGSRDGSLAMVAAEFPEVVCLAETPECGYSAANNLALRQCRGTYRLLLNPDTELPRDAVAGMVAFMDTNPRVGIAGPKLVKGNGLLDLACRRSFPTPTNALYHFLRLPRLFPENSTFGAYNLTYRDPNQSYEVDSVCGAFMLLRATMLNEVGLLDETYWMYGEDLDLAFRAKQRGWKVYYNAGAEVKHYKGESSKQRSLKCTYEFFRAMHLFYRKHYASQQPAVLNALVTTGIALLGTVSLVADRLRPVALRRVSS
ncbi:MAG: glycosyl transferase [Dehalococcoidia bacterium]|nr:glycosyl transferase [Dehalococcoidia bacterium]